MMKATRSSPPGQEVGAAVGSHKFDAFRKRWFNESVDDFQLRLKGGQAIRVGLHHA